MIRTKKRKLNKKALIYTLIGIGITSFAVVILIVNISGRRMEKYTEITFVSPTQALIFWKSKDNTLGYVKYSEKILGKRETVLQTSSEPGDIHVVFLENIPLEGIYIWKINESDSILFFQPSIHIKYENQTDE